MLHEQLQRMIDPVEIPEEVELSSLAKEAQAEAYHHTNGTHNTAPSVDPETTVEAEPEILIPYGSPYIADYNPDDYKDETPWVETFPQNLEEAARYFTQRNIAVFPTKGKVPDTHHGCKDATLSQNGIVNMLRDRKRKNVPNLGLGVDCEKSGLFFLDVDVKPTEEYPDGMPGMASLAALEEKYEKLPHTWKSQTASGGLHYWFRGHGRNTVSRGSIGVGLDTRGDGGYIVAPPTTFENGTGYTWIHSPDDTELANAPQWLLDLTAKNSGKTTETASEGMITPPPPSSSSDEIVTEGARNNRLFSHLGLRRAQGCGYNELLAIAFVWNQEHCSPPLDEEEVRGRVDSVMRYPVDAGRIQRDKDRTNLMMVEGTNRLAQEGQAQFQQEQIKRVTPEIVEDEPPPLIDWMAYVDDAIVTGAVEKIFDESFLAYFAALWDNDRDAAADFRKRLMSHIPNFDLKGFNTAIKALKDRITQDSPPKQEGDLPEGAVVVPIDYSAEFIGRCLNSRLKESNEMLQRQMLTRFAECQMNLQADMQMIIGLMHNAGLSDTNITAVIETLKQNAQIEEDDEFDIAYRYQFTPMGNATRLAECYHMDHKYCPQEQTWLHYERGIWNKDADETCIKWRAQERLTNPIGELTQLVAQPNYNDLNAKEKRFLIRSIRMWAQRNQTPEAIKGALFFAETHPAFKITPDAFDTQPYLFNVKNGTIDLRTGIRYHHRPDDFLRTIANVEYDPDATCPEWEAFITFALGDDHDVLRTFQQAVGYGLWGTNEAKKFFILYGPTGTGKSQVIATLQKLAGMYGMACPPKTILDRRATDSSNELVDLYTHRMAFVSELSEKDRFSEATIKAFTGGTVLSARRLYGEYQEFSPPTTLFIDTNEMSHFNINDWAFLDRMVVFTFAKMIKESKKPIDNFAENVLYPELPGILNWAIKGAMNWWTHRFTIPVSCRQAVDKIRTDKDRVAEFLATKATPNPVAVLKATVLWELYKEWYKANYPSGSLMGSKTFYENLAAISGVKKHERKDANYYSGYELKEELSHAEALLERHKLAIEVTQDHIANMKPPTEG